MSDVSVRNVGTDVLITFQSDQTFITIALPPAEAERLARKTLDVLGIRVHSEDIFKRHKKNEEGQPE